MQKAAIWLRRIPAWGWALSTLLLMVIITALAPLERTLGANVRTVYFHGAWVWVGKIAFAAAALTGLAALIRPQSRWAGWTLALGRTGLFFWLTYLPMSLLVMQMNWGGLFLDEPRFRNPLTFAIVGSLLQLGISLLESPRLTGLGNLVFGVALWWVLGETENILHPDSPIFTSGGALSIQAVFIILLGLGLLFGALLAAGFHRWQVRRS